MLGASQTSQRPVRVLAYADSLEFSGAESAFAALVAGLDRLDGLEIDAAVPVGRMAGLLAGSARALHLLPSVPLRAGLSAFDPRLIHRVRTLAASGRYDAILVNLPSAQAGTAGLLTRLPSVAYLHVPQSLAATGFKLGSVRDRLARPRLDRASRVVVPAPSVRRHVVEAWGLDPERVGWAPPPFRALSTVSRERAQATLALAPGRARVGIIGRVTFKQKGHDLLLTALARLVRAGTDVELVVAGEGADLQALSALAAGLGLADRVRLLGALADPAPFYAAIDLVAIPSRFEGLPLVALEALSLGVPGVASRVDGLRDVWPAAWLVEGGDPAALAVALGDQLAQGREALSSHAASHWQQIAGRYGAGTVERFACELRSVLP